MSSAFRAVLFDWRGTLFHDEDEADWIRASAASIGRSMTSSDMIALVEGLGPAVARITRARTTHHGTAAQGLRT